MPISYRDDRVTERFAGSQSRASTALQGDAVPAAGTKIGRFIVGGELGRGGMGYVVLAHETAAPFRTVALKIARPTCPAAGDRLHREADALRRVHSRYVVAPIDVGVTEEGRAWLAMEYVPGPTLRQLANDGAPVPRLLRALRDLGAGLAAAHEAGVLHRDVKSANVVVGHDGHARLLDFGLALTDGRTSVASAPMPIARDEDSLPTEERFTETGVSIGTPAYMAPEQHLGRVLDERCDQFGLAVTAYETLLCARPYAGPSANEYLQQKIGGHIREPSLRAHRQVGPRRIDAILRGLASAPAGRWRDVPAMIDAIT